MLTADRAIATGLMALSAYFMWHASVLPIGWNGMTGGPGGGAFPFWLSAIMFVMGGTIILRSFRGQTDDTTPFFDPETMASVFLVVGSLVVTVALIPFVGSYIALPLFLLWYLRVYGKHS
jgi:hypothetical protein